MSEPKKLSLIIPCYNSAKYLPECLESLRNQTVGLSEVELIFVDDASTDGGETLDMLYDFQKEVPDARIIRHEINKRQGGSRNTGVANATGIYVGFMDADDFIAPDYVEKLLPIAFDNDADILQFGHYDFTTVENGQKAIVGKCEREFEIVDFTSVEQRKGFVLDEKMTLGNWNKLYRREMLVRSAVKFKENGFYEEPPFTFPLRFYVNRYVTTDGFYYFCRLHADSSIQVRMKEFGTLKNHLESCLQLFDFMRQTEFYQDYSDEINLKFFHSYIFETMFFCGQREFVMSLSLYEEIRKNFFDRVGYPFENPYAPPGTFYYTLSEVVKRDTMTQELLNDVIDAVKDYNVV